MIAIADSGSLVTFTAMRRASSKVSTPCEQHDGYVKARLFWPSQGFRFFIYAPSSISPIGSRCAVPTEQAPASSSTDKYSGFSCSNSWYTSGNRSVA
jgi:hypothetical protein